MRRKQRRIQAPSGDQLQKPRSRERVHETGRDRDVLGPKGLQMQRCRVAVNADVRDMPTGPDEFGAELERLGKADGFDRNVGTEAVGELVDERERILAAVVDRHVGAERLRLFEPRVG